jgi:hypothetical protein
LLSLGGTGGEELGLDNRQLVFVELNFGYSVCAHVSSLLSFFICRRGLGYFGDNFLASGDHDVHQN